MLRPSIIATTQPDFDFEDFTRTSESWKNMLQSTTEDDSTRALAYIFKNEFDYHLVNFERQKIENNNSILNTFLEPQEGLEWLSIRQRKILNYYAPFLTDLRSDLDLMSRCFSAILETKILVERIQPFLEDDAPQLNYIQLNSGCTIGGKGEVTNPCFKISIHSIPTGLVSDFLLGGGRRDFLQNALCPVFLPYESLWEIELLTLDKGNRDSFKGEIEGFVGLDLYLI